MSRLGLWGRGTPFPQGFLQFTKEVESHGVGAMELVAMDLKQTGKFMSRTLAFEGDCWTFLCRCAIRVSLLVVISNIVKLAAHEFGF